VVAEPHLPPPTLWPLGFAIGIAVILTLGVIIFARLERPVLKEI